MKTLYKNERKTVEGAMLSHFIVALIPFIWHHEYVITFRRDTRGSTKRIKIF